MQKPLRCGWLMRSIAQDAVETLLPYLGILRRNWRQRVPNAPEFFHLFWFAKRNPRICIEWRERTPDGDVVLPEVGNHISNRTTGIDHHEIRGRRNCREFAS